MNTTVRRGGSLVGPLILIAIGVIFLLNNLGYLPWSIWQVLFRLWPLILIAIGLDILIGRRSIWGALIVLVLVVLMFGAAIAFMVVPNVSALYQGQPLATNQIDQPLQGATGAIVELDPGIGTLQLVSSADSNSLLSGQVTVNSNLQVIRDFSMNGNTANLRVRQNANNFPAFMGPNNSNPVWTLSLTRAVPVSLKVDSGVATSTLDLTDMQISELTVSAGVGRVDVTMPAKGHFTARIDGGVGDMTITVPQGMAARAHVDRGLSRIDLRSDLTGQDDVYSTQGFDTATDRVDMFINGGLGRITIR